MRQERSQARVFTRRALLLGGGQAVLFAALGARLYYLQVVEASRYTMLADENRINVRLLPENPCHRPDALADDPELSVWGVATSVVHCLRR